MRLLVAMIGTAGLASVVLMLLILARLSRRWEAVTRSRSYYRLFYVAGALVALAALSRLVRIGHLAPLTGLGQYPAGESALTASPLTNGQLYLYPFLEPRSWFYLAFYHLPLAAAATVSLILAWRNWGWLLRVQEK